MSNIREISTFISDGDWIESQDQSDYGIRLIQTGNIGNGEYLDKPDKAKYISEETYNKLHCTDVYPGDILISRLPDPIGRSCMVPQDIGRAITAVDCTILRVNRSNYNPHFFVYYTQTDLYRSKLSYFLTGTTRKRISRKNLEKIVVPHYSREYQDTIVKRLEKITHLISMRTRQLDKLDELVKSRFLELFGDPLAGNAKWPIHNLCMVADAIDPQPSHRAPPIDKNGIPYISIKDCDYNTGKIDFEKARKVNVKVLQEQKTKYQIHNGDMMIGKIGTIGYPVFLPTYETYTLSANVILIQPNKSKVQPCFLKYSLESPYVESQFDKAKHSTSQSAFGILKIRKIKVMNPELSIQNQFADFVNQVDKSKLAVQKSLDELETLKKSLMQTYFG